MTAASARRPGPVRTLVAAVLLVLLGSDPAAAELRRLEVVGVAPVEPGAGGAPQQAALDHALAEAVGRVVRDLAPSAASGEDARAWAAALGGPPVDYAVSYRVIEDRGERPALLSPDPGVERELTLLVEVVVDAGRVAERLRAKGLAAPLGPAGGAGSFRLAVHDVRSWAALDALRTALVDRDGAAGAVPEEVSSGRVVLRVQDAGGAGRAVARLLSRPPEGLALAPDADSAADAAVRITGWVPPGSAEPPLSLP